MSCCHCQGAELFFDKTVALKEIKQYRQKGPDKTTKILLEALKAKDLTGMTLLDIGGGVGVIQHELLKAGIAHATSVEASPAYLAAAQEQAGQQGTAAQIDAMSGDFVELAADVPQADVVTLHRVICCYPDMPTQVGLSLEKSLKYYALVYPRAVWWSKLSIAFLNFTLWLRQNPFRTFVHSEVAVDRLIRKNGFAQNFVQKTFFWKVAVYERQA